MTTFYIFNPEALFSMSENDIKSTINSLSIYNLSKSYVFYREKILIADKEKISDIKKYKLIVKLIKERCYALKLTKIYSISFRSK